MVITGSSRATRGDHLPSCFRPSDEGSFPEAYTASEERVQPLVHEGPAAGGRLADFGLSVDDLHFALRGADAEARTWTRLAPPAMPGMARWGKTNELLRVRLIPRRWSSDNPNCLPRTISPGKDFAVVATAGDAMTGLPDGQPATKYAKGLETARAIERNVQLAFDLPGIDIAGALSAVVSSDAEMATWLLLYHVTGAEICAELSLANGISLRGHVDSWAERIILPPIDLSGPDIRDRRPQHEEEREGATVAVERR
jgi:hypothetical protein